MIFHKDKLLEHGGTHHDRIKKWEKKTEEAKAQETFPVDKPEAKDKKATDE